MTADLMAMTNFGPGFEVKELKEIGFLTWLRHLKKGAEPVPVKNKKVVVYWKDGQCPKYLPKDCYAPPSGTYSV
jgi:hypothetical protein